MGLIGDLNYNIRGLKEAEDIPADQRLARFEAMFEFGGDASGPGLFGRGKLIFNVASKSRTVVYDFRTGNGEYRLGIRRIEGRDYHQFPTVKEGAEAEGVLSEMTNDRLTPPTEPGTRITIIDPQDDVIAALVSGEMLEAIEETWWEAIQKHKASISVQVLPGRLQTAKVPKDFGALPEKSGKGWQVLCRENIRLPIDGSTYRIKRLHFLIAPPKHVISEHLCGLRFHRKGMVVGRVNLSGIPTEVTERFFGYVFLDKGLEQAIAEQESTTHYGITSPNRSPYRNLRQLAQSEFDQFLESIGLKKRTSSTEERVRRLAEDAQADLNSILSTLGVPGFGTGKPKRAQLHLSVTGLEFPGGTNQLALGDEIQSFSFRLDNPTRKAETLWWRVYTYERDSGELDVLSPRQRVNVRASGGFASTEDLTITLTSPPYVSYSKVACVCEVVDDDGHIVVKKSFYFYVDLKADAPDRWAELRLAFAEFPRDSRRLDYGESLTNILYEFENMSVHPMKVRLRARTLWAGESNAEIESIGGTDLEVGPFEGKVFACPDIEIKRSTYEEVARGKVNIRCHAAALESSAVWQKGERLAENTVSFYLNMDPAYGFWESTMFHDGGSSQPRSEPRAVDSAGRSWELAINQTHPAYLQTEADELRRTGYLFEEMARQTIAILLRMNQEEAIVKLASLGTSERTRRSLAIGFDREGRVSSPRQGSRHVLRGVTPDGSRNHYREVRRRPRQNAALDHGAYC